METPSKCEYVYKKLREYIMSAGAPWEGGPAWRYWDGVDQACDDCRKAMEDLEREYHEIHEEEGLESYVELDGGD